MNWFHQLKYKTRIGLLLAAIMCIILLNNISGRHSFDDLNQSITSIYQDRLMPATYIFRITDHLYQKRMLHQQTATDQQATAQIRLHDNAIMTLIRDYEATHLTREEQHQWNDFKKHLLKYNVQEQQSDNIPAAKSFDRTIQCLNALSTIQAGEGHHLRESSTAIISANTIRSSLEIGLLIVLGIVTLVLIGVSKEAILQAPQKPSLN